jgi:hypothetical protein
MTKEITDATCVWAFGIAEPGWYCAKSIWDQAYAAHLQSLNYRVVRSIGKPTIDGRPTDVFGRPTPEAA